MSDLTPEAARAVAAWMDGTEDIRFVSSRELRAEADRLEAATRTPGQVLFEAEGRVCTWDAPEMQGPAQARFEKQAAAVIDHVVGPGRVVVDRAILEQAWESIDMVGGRPVLADRLREALS